MGIAKRNILLPTDLYKEARRRLDELMQIEQQLTIALSKAPKGDVRIAKTGKRIQFYLRECSNEQCGKYISKTEQSKISTYLQKRYNEKLLSLIQQEISSIQSFLQSSNVLHSKHSVVFEPNLVRNSINVSTSIKSLYSKLPSEIKNYISPIDMSDEDYISQWISQEYKTKDLGENAPFYITDKGEQVRSKSELNIANALFKHKIPYRYEAPLLLKGKYLIYPDFTILYVKTRKETYWEHRGMMDDRDYAKHSVGRIKDYQEEGIYFGERLIITEETSTQPLGTREIEAIINHYFIKG